jgi:multidrug efflux pump subunit AcrA (membrane-fusion protein)
MNKYLILLVFISNVWADAPTFIPLTDAQIQSMGIQVADMIPANTALGLHLPARVTIPPSNIQVVSAPQSGIVLKTFAAVGQEIKQNQTLIKLQSAELLNLQKNYLQALTRQVLAEADSRRDLALFKEGIIAKRRHLESQGKYAETTADTNAQREILRLSGMSEAAIENLSKTRKLAAIVDIVAPTDGVVLENLTTSGQRVNGLDPLCKLAKLDVLWLDIRATLEQIAGLQVGQAVSISETGSRGKIILLGREVEPANQTVLVRAELTEGTDRLQAGQFVQVHPEMTVKEQSWHIPTNALARSGKENVIFMRVEKGFQVQPVQIISNHEQIAVVSGNFQSNQSIAVNGLANLKALWLK